MIDENTKTSTPYPKSEECEHGDNVFCMHCPVDEFERKFQILKNLKPTPTEKKEVKIVPSQRIDYCGVCKRNHGYDCPLDTLTEKEGECIEMKCGKCNSIFITDSSYGTPCPNCFKSSFIEKEGEDWEKEFNKNYVQYATGSGEHFRWGIKPPEIKRFIKETLHSKEKEIRERIASLSVYYRPIQVNEDFSKRDESADIREMIDRDAVLQILNKEINK